MAAKSLKAVLVVLSNCTEAGREKEFKDWYVNTHLPDVLETPGIIEAKLFSLADATDGRAEQFPGDITSWTPTTWTLFRSP